MKSPGEFLSREFLKVKYTCTRLRSGGCRVLLKALSNQLGFLTIFCVFVLLMFINNAF